jgi:hypothetical protein
MAFFGKPPYGKKIQSRMEYLPEVHRAFCDPTQPQNITIESKDPFVVFAFM